MVIGGFYLSCENTEHDKLLNKHKTDVLAPVAWPNVPFFRLISTILCMSTAMEAVELATARKLHHLCMVFWFGFQNTDKSGGCKNPFRKKGGREGRKPDPTYPLWTLSSPELKLKFEVL